MMKRTISVIRTSFTVVLATTVLAVAQSGSQKMQQEVLRAGKELSQAIVKNDVDAVGRFLAEDWIVIDPDGGIVDKARFLEVIKSGVLTHEMMESSDSRVRIYGNTAVVTALTTTKGSYSGQSFATTERATDVFVQENGRWLCVLSHLTRFTKK
jgi:ketosteroid isomerase-like protein